MTVSLAKEIMEQYFKLFNDAGVERIKKAKSLLETLKTWTKNSVTKKKTAKVKLMYERQYQFLERFSQSHERIVAFNVLLALFKFTVIRYENDSSNALVHNTQLVNKAGAIINEIVEGKSKESLLCKHLSMSIVCFNDVEIDNFWGLPNDRLNDCMKKLLTGQLRFDPQPPARQ